MDEIEVKILDINKAEIISKLLELGAEKAFDGPVETMFYDTKNMDLRRLKKILRLRRMGEKVFLTYKQKISQEHVKIYDEEEVEVNDLETMQKMLENLGYQKKKHIMKYRTSYALDGVKFEIDQFAGAYKFFPPFLEIEAANKDIIYGWAEKLGFSKEDCTAKSTGDLIKEFMKK
ncbi:MAG: class IV adenylate cyclase [Nanoarchaeota archaeon]